MSDLRDGATGECLPAAAGDPQYAYNYIFQDLVSDERDLFGIVAYSIYKRHKISWLEHFKNEHGREPTPQEVKVFNDSSRETLGGYRSQAQTIVREYVDAALEEMASDLVAGVSEDYEAQIDALDERIATGVDAVLAKHRQDNEDALVRHRQYVEAAFGKRAAGIEQSIKSVKTTFWHAVFEHVVAGVIAIILAGFLYMLLTFYYDPDSVKNRVANSLLKKSGEPPTLETPAPVVPRSQDSR